MTSIIPTQADRERAWPFAPHHIRYDPNPGVEARWENGAYDQCEVIQAFARHRLAAEARIQSQTVSQDQVERMREALTPSGDTKAAYMGEFSFNLTQIDESGDERQVKTYVPWTTIKEIMAAIRARAALSPSGSMNDVG